MKEHAYIGLKFIVFIIYIYIYIDVLMKVHASLHILGDRSMNNQWGALADQWRRHLNKFCVQKRLARTVIVDTLVN